MVAVKGKDTSSSTGLDNRDQCAHLLYIQQSSRHSVDSSEIIFAEKILFVPSFSIETLLDLFFNILDVRFCLEQPGLSHGGSIKIAQSSDE